MRRLLWVSLATAGIGCTAPHDGSAGPEPGSAPLRVQAPPSGVDECAPTDTGPVLVRVQTRDRTITVHGHSSHDAELRFSVADEDGAPLERGLTREALRRRYPELDGAYERAFADTILDGGGGTWGVDASVFGSKVDGLDRRGPAALNGPAKTPGRPGPVGR